MLNLVVLIGFAVAMLGIGWLARSRVSDVEDFVVAGRRLGLPLATSTVLATWFGAGTLLVAADEVREHGLRAAALDPIGSGLCLILAGVLLAGPLWRRKLTTLSDFYRDAFGPRAETASAVLMVPGYLGWIAAQFSALGALLVLVAGLDPTVALLAAAAVGIGYTLLGGMWAVTLTDAVQVVLMIVGLVVLAGVVLLQVGGGDAWLGLGEIWANTPEEHRIWIPAGAAGVAWTSALLAGALGNLPGQDLAQRVFAARSARVAIWACVGAGVLYLLLGGIPVLLALGADSVAPDLGEGSVLAVLASATLHPAVALVFTLTVASAVLSTIDSAILAPATVIARNGAARFLPETVGMHRLAILGVGVASLIIAALGEDAYALLEASYEVTMVSLLVPLLGGLYWPRGERACLAAMAVGTGLWAVHLVQGFSGEPWEGFFGSGWPMGLCCTVLAGVVYVGFGAANGGGEA